MEEGSNYTKYHQNDKLDKLFGSSLIFPSKHHDPIDPKN